LSEKRKILSGTKGSLSETKKILSVTRRFLSETSLILSERVINIRTRTVKQRAASAFRECPAVPTGSLAPCDPIKLSMMFRMQQPIRK
jgi:hypothetical protein